MPEDCSPKPRIAHRRKARGLLVQALYQWQLAEGGAADIESQFRLDNPGKKIDWDFFSAALSYIHRNATTVDDTFQPFLDRKLADLDPIELAILRLGAYELQERLDVPYRVVINECVDLAKTFGATDSHKYINGVLDKLARKLRAVEVNARRA